MATINLEELTVRELREVIATAQSLIGQKINEERQAALKEAREVATKWGYDLADLLQPVESEPQKPRRTSTRALKPKFRHPENAGITWSGVGRRPKWIVEAEANGTLESLRMED